MRKNLAPIAFDPCNNKYLLLSDIVVGEAFKECKKIS